MKAREKIRKFEMRKAHAERRDNRQPDHPLTANQRRNGRRDARRKEQKAVREALKSLTFA